VPGVDQRFGRSANGIGTGDQIGFARLEEIDQRRQRYRITGVFAQGSGIQPGKRKEAGAEIRVARDMGEGLQRQDFRRKSRFRTFFIDHGGSLPVVWQIVIPRGLDGDLPSARVRDATVNRDNKLRWRKKNEMI
jgi:hypothetical protein